jgi:GT2 family glycosyltransferase
VSGDTAQGGVLLSVVIPTHNRRSLLARLLASLEKQTLEPSRYEVLIVHNYTPDATEEMARAWCERQPFRAIYYKKNHNGPTRSRDFGARTAQGRFVAFIDDDCVTTPGWLEGCIAAFDGAGEGGDTMERAGSGVVGLVQGRTLPMLEDEKQLLVKTVRIEGPTLFFETCNIFYRKSAFDAVGGFSEDFLDRFSGEDTDLGWKVTGHGYKAAFAPEALAYHEVFRVSYWKWLAESPLVMKNIPYLAKKYPGLRAHMFHPCFFSKETFLFNIFLLALATTIVSPLAGGILSLPYIVERYRSGGHVGGFFMRIARVVFGVPRGMATWWTLAKGSIRDRVFLL